MGKLNNCKCSKLTMATMSNYISELRLKYNETIT